MADNIDFLLVEAGAQCVGQFDDVRHILVNGQRGLGMARGIQLVQGVICLDLQARYLVIIVDLISTGVQGIILGCTEIGLLLTSASCATPLFGATWLHVEVASAKSLAE